MSPGSFEALSDLDGKRRVEFGVPGSARGRSQPWEDFFEGSSTIFIIGVVEEGDVMDAPVPHESADDGGEFAVTSIPLRVVVARNVVGFWGRVGQVEIFFAFGDEAVRAVKPSDTEEVKRGRGG